MRRTVLLLAVVATASCSRDLELPQLDRVTVSPAFIALAPREARTFVASGGGGGYRFAFAPGGKLSGDDATIDPASGAYQAGSVGSALDVLEVTDGGGRKATAQVSVGLRLTLTPSLTGTAPGNAVAFTASGGKAPYAFGLASNASGASLDAALGRYQAGAAAGDVVDVVEVRDATGDPAAVARAEVHVGTRLTLYRSETRAVAPREQVAFIAFGGQPPYRYALSSAGSGDPAAVDPSLAATVDPASGLYTAGARPGDDGLSSVTDVVTVTDSATPARQSDSRPVSVGPRLRFVSVPAEVYAGTAARVTAAGGKLPYTFGFADRLPPAQDPLRARGGNGGNRSSGTLDAASGEYRPGPGVGAVDHLQVKDATGVTATVAAPPVRAARLRILPQVQACFPGDFDGDRAEDVAFVANSDSAVDQAAVTVALRLGDDPLLQVAWPTQIRLWRAWPHDLTGLGRAQVLFVGGEHGGGHPADLWAGVPDPAGLLDWVQLAATGGAPWQVYTGVAAWDAAAGVLRVFAHGFGGGCGGFMRFDWHPGEAGPRTPAVCLTDSSTGGAFSLGSGGPQPLALAAADLNGDGRLDLAWILGGAGEAVTGGALHVAYATGPASFGARRSGWPAPAASWTFEGGARARGDTRLVVLPPPPGAAAGTPDALLVRLTDAAGRGKLFLLRDPQAPGFSPPFDPYPVASPGGVSGVATYVPAPGLPTAAVAWTGTDGRMRGFGVTGFGAGETLSFQDAYELQTLPFPVNLACFVDANSDGSPDLVAIGDWAGSAEIVLGNGASATPATAASGGDFSARLHLRGVGYPFGVADFDGDGFGDVVAATGAASAVFWGGGGQLARGQEVIPAAVAATAAGDFTGAGRPSIAYRTMAGDFGVVAYEPAAAAFAPPVTVPVHEATSALPGTSADAQIWLAADLGTAAPGVDLLGLGRNRADDSQTVQVFLAQRDASQALRFVHVPSVPLPYDAGAVPIQCGALAVGAGQPEVVAVCGHRLGGGLITSAAAWRGTVANPDAPPGSAAPASMAWTRLTPAAAAGAVSAWPTGFVSDYRGVTQAGTVPAGWPGAVEPGTGVYVMYADRLYAVEVGPDLVPRAYAVTPEVKGFLPEWAAVGRLHPGSASWFDVAVASADAVLVLQRDAAGYRWTQRLSGVGLAAAITPLSPASAGDLLTFFLGVPGRQDLLAGFGVLLNDGAGGLR